MQKSFDPGVVSWRWRAALLFGAAIAADRLTKLYFLGHTPQDHTRWSFIVSLVQHQNYGMLANLPVPRIVILVVSLAAIGGIGYMTWRDMRAGATIKVLALSLLLAGAIGNLWDRISYGFVFDWILIGGRSIINLADIFIGVGLVWYAWLVQQERKRS